MAAILAGAIKAPPSALSEDDFAEELARLINVQLAEMMGEGTRRQMADVGVIFEEAVTNEAASQWARGYSFDLISGLVDTTRDAVSQAIDAFTSTPGMTRAALEQRLAPAFGPARAEAIAVTEVTRAYSEASNYYQGQLRQSGIDMERVWRTSADELVCPICEPLNGRPESIWGSDYPNGPAAHVRCRCGTTLRLAPESRQLLPSTFRDIPSDLAWQFKRQMTPNMVLGVMKELSEKFWRAKSAWNGKVTTRKSKAWIASKMWDCSIKVSEEVAGLVQSGTASERTVGLKTLVHEYLHAFGRYSNEFGTYDSRWKQFVEEATTEILARDLTGAIIAASPRGVYTTVSFTVYEQPVRAFSLLAESKGIDPTTLALQYKARMDISPEAAVGAAEWLKGQISPLLVEGLPFSPKMTVGQVDQLASTVTKLLSKE